MDDPNSKSKTEAAAERFATMVSRLGRNAGDDFGGAFVAVPPDGAEPVETLILDPQQDLAQFWAMLKTRCDIELAKIDERQRVSRSFGR